MITPRLKKIIEIIKQNKPLQRKNREISRIAEEIFNANGYALTGRAEEAKFIPTRKEVSVKDFIRDWGHWLDTRYIPFEYWSDICEEGLVLTLKFIESNLEDYKELEGYKELREKYTKRIVDELPKSGKFTAEDMRAWDDMGY